MHELKLNALAEHGLSIDLSQYLGLWAIEEHSFATQWMALTEMGLVSHLSAGPVVQTKPASTKPAQARLAQIEIRGTMTKNGSSMSNAGATSMIRRDVRNAMNSSEIDGVLLLIESPGGTVAGTQELADDIAALAAVKPVVTLYEDQGASAALWVGSMSTKVFATTAHAMVGSMGAMIGLYDSSGAAASKGIKPIVIRSGELKGAGMPGTELTDNQKQMFQAYVDAAFAAFSSSMKAKRNLTAAQMTELSKGGIYSAKDAIALGLIDGIRSYEAAVAELRGMVSSTKKERKMSENSTPSAASLTELEAACRGADEKFLVAQLKKGATLSAASGEWMNSLTATNVELGSQLKASQEENAKLKAELEAEKAKSKSGGSHAANKVLPTSKAASTNEGGSLKDQWNSAVAEKVKLGLSKPKAIAAVVASNPELHKAFIEESNVRA